MKNHITCIEDDLLNVDLRLAVRNRIRTLQSVLAQCLLNGESSEVAAIEQEISRLENFIREI